MAPFAASGLIGFAAAELLGSDSSGQVQQLEQMKSMGMNTVRVDADWSGGEPSQGNFDWSNLDTIMASVHQVGMTADLIIDGCPPWAAAAGATGQFAQPASPAQFAAWAGAVAARYDSLGADYFEVWNEPNLAEFWSPAPNPDAYTADLVAAYAAIKAADPSSLVISAGLAAVGDTDSSIDPVTFFGAMYAHGAHGSFDAVGDHPYSFPADPDTDSQGTWGEMDQTSPSLRSLMIAHGDAAKKIWITEFGAPTGVVTQTQQATELTQAITAAKNTSWIGAFYIYTWSDQFGGAGFGLLDSNGNPKPAYTAVAALTS
jgi:polysaccharide biosynthesis protein PslG